MKQPRKNSPNRDPAKSITADEVTRWFGNSKRSRLHNTRYATIADTLNSFRWPSDPVPEEPPSSSEMQMTADSDKWWDFDKAYKAANTLFEVIPQMQTHWRNLVRSPEVSAGERAIEKLAIALADAMSFIRWPFGKYEPQTGRKRAKDWHTYSSLIAKLVIEAMIQEEHKPAISVNSVVVGVVWKAMRRMNVPPKTLTRGAIAQHLARKSKKLESIVCT
jgi:hypothetical protein